MPLIISQEELDSILEVLGRFPNGVPVRTIMENLNFPITRKNLFHRLNLLREKEKIIAEGEKRGLLYRLKETQVELAPEFQQEAAIVLSEISEELQKQLRKPIQERNPVGYKREFLDGYIPNETYYLPENIRKRFFELGKTDGKRPAGTYAREIFNRLLIDLSWNSSRLEGNNYSLLETERLIKLSAYAEGKDIQEAQMILNHKEAIEFLVESVDEIGVNNYTIFNLHALLAFNLLANPDAEGRIRNIAVGIGKSVYRPLVNPSLIQECFQQILDTAQAILDPFEQAFFLMVHLPYLQPFEDVNKRVSRLSANIPLIQQNLSPLSFIDVPQDLYVNGLLAVYELNRIELLRDVFIWAYPRSCAIYSKVRHVLGEPDPFRTKYHSSIYEAVQAVVVDRLDKLGAIRAIQKRSETIPEADQGRFIEMVEKELLALHKGNIARFRIRPSQFEEWHRTWV